MVERAWMCIVSLFCHVVISNCVFGRTAKMAAGNICGVQDKLTKGCLTVKDNVFSSIQCAMHCVNDDKCEGFGVDRNVKTRCYVQQHCRGPEPSCLEDDFRVRYFKRWPTPDGCLNGGAWIAETETCECSDGFVGLRCERYAESCRELLDSGYKYQSRKKTFLLPPGFSAPFQTNCALLVQEIRTDLVHQNAVYYNTTNNARTWAEYVEGYYSPDSDKTTRDFWLGLDKIHYLNTVAGLRQLNMVINLGSDLTSYTFIYTGVVVGGADADYSLSYADVTVVTNDTSPDGRFLNCFTGNGPVPFSTPDADHDADLNLNCAAEAGAGWWFSQCDPNPECNPLGLHYVTGNEAVTPKRMRFNGVEMQKHASDFSLFRMYFSEPS